MQDYVTGMPQDCTSHCITEVLVITHAWVLTFMTAVLSPSPRRSATDQPCPCPRLPSPAVATISQLLLTFMGRCNMLQFLQDPESSTGGVQKSVKTGVANALLAMLKCNAAEAVPWRKRVSRDCLLPLLNNIHQPFSCMFPRERRLSSNHLLDVNVTQQ